MSPAEHVTVFLLRLIEAASAVVTWIEAAEGRHDSERRKAASCLRRRSGSAAEHLECPF